MTFRGPRKMSETVDHDPADALGEAVQKAGGVCALARALGVKHPSVIKWRRVPANRVLDVERISGVPRTRLRPDLYPSGAA